MSYIVFVTHGAVITSNILAALATWWYMSHLVCEQSCTMKSTLSRVMLEDGAVYFVVLMLLNIADIVVFAATHENWDISTCIYLFSYILTSHFLLHIRKVADRSMHIGSQRPSFIHSGTVMPTCSGISSIEFASNSVAPSGGQETDEGNGGADSFDGEGHVSTVDGDIGDEEGQEHVVELAVPLKGGIYCMDQGPAMYSQSEITGC